MIPDARGGVRGLPREAQAAVPAAPLSRRRRRGAAGRCGRPGHRVPGREAEHDVQLRRRLQGVGRPAGRAREGRTDMVWVPEAYSFDAISQVGYLVARTERVEIGTGIVNVRRGRPLMAMTAAGCDYVSNGRFVLGLGASGPQVVEGFHGIPDEKPMTRIKEYIDICRMTWRRGPGRVRRRGRAGAAPGRAGHRPGQAAQADQPSRAVRHPDLVGVAHGQERGGHRGVRRRLAPDHVHPRALPAGVGRPAEGRAGATPARAGRLEVSAGGMVAIGEDLVGDALGRGSSTWRGR